MLRGFWNIVRLSFKKRFVVYYVVVWGFTLFGILPNLIAKFAAFAVLVVASVLFLPIFSSQFVSQLRQILAYRHRERFPVPYEIADLSRRIGAQVSELGIVKGCNAYVWRRCLVLEMELLELLTFDERQAVVGHELGHIKEKHAILRGVLLIPLLAVPLYSWSRLSSPIFFTKSLTQIIVSVMLNIALLAFVMIITIPINWYFEVRADRIAARYVGKENIKSALLKLGKKKNLKEPSETHPSIAERVRLIEKLD